MILGERGVIVAAAGDEWLTHCDYDCSIKLALLFGRNCIFLLKDYLVQW